MSKKSHSSKQGHHKAGPGRSPRFKAQTQVQARKDEAMARKKAERKSIGLSFVSVRDLTK